MSEGDNRGMEGAISSAAPGQRSVRAAVETGCKPRTGKSASPGAEIVQSTIAGWGDRGNRPPPRPARRHLRSPAVRRETKSRRKLLLDQSPEKLHWKSAPW